MSGLRSSGLLVVLAAPFALYALWQVQAAARPDFAAPPPPAEKGPPDGKRLAETKSKAEKWAADVRQASGVALQYRAPGPEDRSEDPDCTALARASAARANDLNDLEKFLSGVDRPTYTGSLKDRYAEWQGSRVKLAKAEETIELWLKNPLPAGVDSQAAAAQAMKGFEDLVAEYRKDARFADSARAAAWQVEARVKVLEALEAAAHRPYDEVLALPLPMPDPKTNKAVDKALGAPAAIREQVKFLEAELARVEEAKRVLPERLTKAAASVVRRADEWAAKEEFLSLLSDPALLTDPNKAADWVPKVQAQFNKSQSNDGRELIRRKVQQFCEAYVPKVARLDAKVLIRGEEVPRAGVVIEYASEAKEQPLTDHPARLNEFNFGDLHKNFDRIRWGNKSAGTRDALRPTPASVAARDFTAARATVTVWSPATVNQLKKKCEGDAGAVQQDRRNLLDTLSGAEPVRDPAAKEPASAWTRENTKIWTRLTVLSDAMAKAPGLFEPGK